MNSKTCLPSSPQDLERAESPWIKDFLKLGEQIAIIERDMHLWHLGWHTQAGWRPGAEDHRCALKRSLKSLSQTVRGLVSGMEPRGNCGLSGGWLCLIHLCVPGHGHSVEAVCALLLSLVQLFMTSGMVAHQALLSMGFFRQEYWSGLPHPLQGIIPTQGLNPCLSCLLPWQADSLPLAPLGNPL